MSKIALNKNGIDYTKSDTEKCTEYAVILFRTITDLSIETFEHRNDDLRGVRRRGD